jgi:hypothetical protein
MRPLSAALFSAALFVACSGPEPLPEPHGPASSAPDRGFPSTGDNPLPLDLAILADAPLRVRQLLESGANPNARWWSRGDRLPIQEAIEFPSYETRQQYRSEIIRLLLQHGADPNARWCPFESRSRDLEKFGIRGCTSDGGLTPLIAAAIRNQPDTIHLLLDAGADPALEDVSGSNTLDYAHEDATLLLLQARMFPERSSRNSETLRYLPIRMNECPGGTWIGHRSASPFTTATHELFKCFLITERTRINAGAFG